MSVLTRDRKFLRGTTKVAVSNISVPLSLHNLEDITKHLAKMVTTINNLLKARLRSQPLSFIAYVYTQNLALSFQPA